ncbi:3-keto-disaccharide hydrolase [Sphingomonas sp. CJ99]
MTVWKITLAAALLASGGCAGTQTMPTDAGTEATSIDRARAVSGGIAATPQRLRLVDLPTPTGPARNLFNGRDLNNWQGWLGYPDPAVTYRSDPGAAPIGTGRDMSGDFAVRMVDGQPAMWVKGETWGSLVHSDVLSNYHLRMQFKWGEATYAPRTTLPRNNGLLYHTHGQPGTVWGTWSPSMEFEIMEGSTGMLVAVGTALRGRTTVAHDASLIEPHLRFQLGGREIDLVNGTPTWNVEAARDAELPRGQWNTLDLYVVGDRAVHVVNGVPVAQIGDMATIAADGSRQPLTQGRIQLQSEGAETWFRNITVEPIASLPRILAE